MDTGFLRDDTLSPTFVWPQGLVRQTLVLLLIFFTLFLGCFVLLGETYVIDLEVLILILALVSVLAGALVTMPRSILPHVLCLSWFQLIFFFPRLFSFLAFPPSSVGFNSLKPVSADDAVLGMAFLLCGTVVMVASFWFASTFFRKTESSNGKMEKIWSIPFGAIVVFWACSLLANYYISHVLGVSIFASPESWGSRSGWLVRVFDIDVALLILLVWWLTPKEMQKRHLVCAFLLLIVWIFVSVLMGSRGGPMRILFVLGLGSIALFGNPLITFRRLVTFVMLTVAATAATFPVASMVRYYLGGVEESWEQLGADWQRLEPIPMPENPTARQLWFWDQKFVNDVASGVSPITMRLGVIDYPLVIVAQEPNEQVVEKYLGVSYALKNYINNMVPGEIFPAFDIMTSRVFTMAYRGYDETHIRTAFLSEPWTSWGFAWIKGGFWGGLVILAALSFVAQSGYQLIQAYTWPPIAPYAAASWLFLATFCGPLQLFGLDHVLTVTSHFYISLIVAFCLIFTCSFGLSRLGVTSSFWVSQGHLRAETSDANSSSISGQVDTR